MVREEKHITVKQDLALKKISLPDGNGYLLRHEMTVTLCLAAYRIVSCD